MIKKITRYSSCMLAALVFVGCEHADPLEEGGQEATLTAIQTSIFSTSCALSGCHVGGGGGLPGALDLGQGRAFTNLVGVSSTERPALNRVEPGDPDNSYLVRKVEGGPNIAGSRMPLGRPNLSQAQIDLIRQWIADGAKEE